MTRKISKGRRLNVARKTNWKCCFCDKTVTTSDWSFEHIIPRCLGGNDKLENLKIAHRKCNQMDGAIIEQMLIKIRGGITMGHKGVRSQRYMGGII